MQPLWNLLRRYKTDHATSSMPLLIYSNASIDPRIGINGPPSPNPLNWHDHRSALGYHLLLHPKSLFGEKFALQVSFKVDKILSDKRAPSAFRAGGGNGSSDLFLRPFSNAEFDHECMMLPPNNDVASSQHAIIGQHTGTRMHDMIAHVTGDTNGSKITITWYH
jgi:hypothetical protein